tara:strand:+ start:565 stop:678 length:114 start_codon:yes stop_codon:yes gene_type:complete
MKKLKIALFRYGVAVKRWIRGNGSLRANEGNEMFFYH